MWAKLKKFEVKEHKEETCIFLYFDYKDVELYCRLGIKSIDYWRKRLNVSMLDFNEVEDILVFRVKDTPFYQLTDVRFKS